MSDKPKTIEVIDSDCGRFEALIGIDRGFNLDEREFFDHHLETCARHKSDEIEADILVDRARQAIGNRSRREFPSKGNT